MNIIKRWYQQIAVVITKLIQKKTNELKKMNQQFLNKIIKQ